MAEFGKTGQFGFRLFNEPHNLNGMMQQDPTGIGQSHPIVAPIEQARADMLL